MGGDVVFIVPLDGADMKTLSAEEGFVYDKNRYYPFKKFDEMYDRLRNYAHTPSFEMEIKPSFYSQSVFTKDNSINMNEVGRSDIDAYTAKFKNGHMLTKDGLLLRSMNYSITGSDNEFFEYGAVLKSKNATCIPGEAGCDTEK